MSGYELSNRQQFVLKWWSNERYGEFDGIICDGAIRSGKTMCMSVSFMLWAMSRFDGASFAMCGKTIVSLRRNVLDELFCRMKEIGMSVREKLSRNYADVTDADATDSTFSAERTRARQALSKASRFRD